MDISIFSDPTRIGPGIWFGMHLDAIVAMTDALKEAFIINVNNLCDNFKCKKCQPHFRKFIDTHPLRNYWNIRDAKGRDIGFFQWTWELHNQVNRFLKKYEPTLDEAYAFFSSTEAGACFNCGGESTSNDSTAQTKEIIEQRTRAIPPILTIYRESGDVKAKPFKLIPINK